MYKMKLIKIKTIVYIFPLRNALCFIYEIMLPSKYS